MRAELNHQAESRPITAASDPSSRSPPTAFPGPRPRQRPPRDCSLLRVPTGRLSRVKLLLLDMSLGTRAQQSEEGVRRAGPVLGPRVFGGHT